MRSESPAGLIRRTLRVDPAARDECALEDDVVEHYRQQLRLALRAPDGSVAAIAIRRGLASLSG
jgi:hypothetical protein